MEGNNLANTIVFFVVMSIVTDAESCSPKLVCRNKPTTSSEFPVRFVNSPPGDTEYACPRSMTKLHCCMEDFTKIQWFEFSPFSKQWMKFRNNSKRYLCEDDQTLMIEETLSFRDFTNYSCVGYGGNSGTIVNNITLHELNCDTKKKSIFLLPSENNTIKSLTLGENHDIYCKVRFGEHQCRTGCNLFWNRKRESDFEVISDGPNTTARIRYNELQSDSIHTSILHIEKIEGDDYTWTYICDGTNLDGERNVFLIEEVPDIAPTVTMAISVTLSIFIVIFFIFTLLGYIYNVEMRVFYKTKIKRKNFKQITDAQHHIFLMYSPDEEDTDFGRSVLTSYLREELGYNVFNTDQTSFGQSVFNSFSNAMETSSVMIVVVSESLMDIEECKVCVRDAINTGHKTIFVIREELSNLNNENRDMMVAIRAGHTVKWYQDGEADQHSCREKQNVQTCRNKLHLKVLSMLEEKETEFHQQCGCFNAQFSRRSSQRNPFVHGNSV